MVLVRDRALLATSTDLTWVVDDVLISSLVGIFGFDELGKCLLGYTGL
jgi:hypothetical protein